MKHFSSLKQKDILTLIGLVSVGFIYVFLISHQYISQFIYRISIFTVLCVALMYLQFWINKPKEIWKYANTIAVVILTVVVCMSLVMHVVIYDDFASKFKHSLLLWAISGLIPYVGGFIYSKAGKR
jgi:FtsH-binding integral membrane protein